MRLVALQVLGNTSLLLSQAPFPVSCQIEGVLHCRPGAFPRTLPMGKEVVVHGLLGWRSFEGVCAHWPRGPGVPRVCSAGWGSFRLNCVDPADPVEIAPETQQVMAQQIPKK